MDVTKPYKFIGFGAMDVTKSYEFIGLGAVNLEGCLKAWTFRHCVAKPSPQDPCGPA